MKVNIHPQSIVESKHIGDNTTINALVHILPDAQLGNDCKIDDHVLIESDVIIGNRVTIKSGVQLWNGMRIEDDVFIGPNVTFTNSLFPYDKQKPLEILKTTVKKGANIGANSTILPGITIGKNSLIGAGAVVTRDVPQNAIVVGNPAYITGYVSQTLNQNQQFKYKKEKRNEPAIIQSIVRGVEIYQLPVVRDMRGSLAVGEYDKYMPFIPKRFFMVYDVENKKIRGEHAHKKLHQFLICVHGSCSVVVDDGFNREEITLDSLDKAIHIPPMVWGIQYKYSKDGILLVLASDAYDPEDYIRDYDDFLKEIKHI